MGVIRGIVSDAGKRILATEYSTLFMDGGGGGWLEIIVEEEQTHIIWDVSTLYQVNCPKLKQFYKNSWLLNLIYGDRLMNDTSLIGPKWVVGTNNWANYGSMDLLGVLQEFFLSKCYVCVGIFKLHCVMSVTDQGKMREQ